MDKVEAPSISSNSRIIRVGPGASVVPGGWKEEGRGVGGRARRGWRTTASTASLVT